MPVRTIDVSILDPFQLPLNMLVLLTLCLVIQPTVCAFDLYILIPMLWTITCVMVLSIVGTGRFIILTLGSYMAYVLIVKALLYLRVPIILDSLAGL
jgi:hypothetical protein